MDILERKCIETWLNEISPQGDVLEIGPSPSLMQLYPFCPQSFTRIDLENITTLPLEKFDFILYNGQAFEQAKARDGNLILKEGETKLQKIKEVFPGLSHLRYSDCDLDTFTQQIHTTQKPYLSRFLAELLENGQITQTQHERQVGKYQLSPVQIKSAPLSKDHLFECIQACLKLMRKGSQFSCLIGVTSRYEDPKFFEHIITNPSFDYQEKQAGNSNYMIIKLI